MNTLTEQQIRPAQFMAKQRIAALTDIGRLLSRCGEFVQVNCPACNANDHEPKFEKNGMSYVTCKECQTFYVNPRPTSEVLGWFYQGSPNYAYWNDVIFPASEAARLERIFVPRVDRLLELCSKYDVQTNSILEIGAGFGTFCSEVKRRNVFSRVVAVEPTPDLAKTCRERGIDVLEQPVEQIQLGVDELFDVVASFEVIEHLFAPIDFVRHMARLLKPGGIMMLTCPNGRGFDIETLGAASNTVDHEHLNYFSPESLATLLVHCGMEVLESFTPGKLDAELVRNKILAGEFDVSEQPFLRKVLIEDWNQLGIPFQEFLVQQGLSSNMWIVARKFHG
ncbi:class I SAM-dependent methyltransferase [Herminiimonas arsenitoxidans]|uniref:class I SAM-dependent methyltransferase n=1 Tax=Herminiimonas arsenitoxidans TaxID=1809410 RepID=UPI0018D2ED39|nr:class I SAM-dependent methyltransferase [Herminiimonas arsenitoxidans]